MGGKSLFLAASISASTCNSNRLHLDFGPAPHCDHDTAGCLFAHTQSLFQLILASQSAARLTVTLSSDKHSCDTLMGTLELYVLLTQQLEAQ